LAEILFRGLFCAVMALVDLLPQGEPIFQSVFDRASVSTITRATQDTSTFVNPSLPGIGGGFLRAVQYRIGSGFGSQYAADIYGIIKSKGNVRANLETKLKQGKLDHPIFYTPFLNFGMSTKYFGVSAFGLGLLSLRSTKSTSSSNSTLSAVPTVQSASFGYGGASFNASVPVAEKFSIGAAVRPLYYGVSDISLNGGNPLSSYLKFAKGKALQSDIGLTFFRRTKFFDSYFATTLRDIGHTKDTKTKEVLWLQTFNAGVGFALHTANTGVHCSADAQDLTNNTSVEAKEKYGFGCRYVATPFIAVAGGYRYRLPHVGFSINLFFTRMEFAYTSVLVTKPQGAQRAVMLSFGNDVP
jgi:hypothetical protein